MNRNDKIVAGIVAGVVGISVIDYIKIVRTERARRREIESKLDKDLLAITAARMKVEKRIEDGEYRGKSIATLLNDLHFEYIIAANQ